MTWGPEQLLSDFPEKLPSDAFARPRIIGDGQDRYWVVWMGIKNGRSSLYMNRSVDGGRKWTNPVSLTGESQSVFGHSLHRAGERMLLVWQDVRTGRDRLYAVTSSDGGVTWTAPARVDHVPESSEVAVTSPSVLLNADGEALVAWQDARNGREDIFLARSTDGGRTWGPEDQRMDADEPGTALSRFPSLARAKDGRVALAWDDDRAGLEDVYVRVRVGRRTTAVGPRDPRVIAHAQARRPAAAASLGARWSALRCVGGLGSHRRGLQPRQADRHQDPSLRQPIAALARAPPGNSPRAGGR